MAGARLFDESDSDYLDWIARHPGGFVINMRRSLRADYMVLHRASCLSISRYTQMAQPGGFTERYYVKAAAATVADLSTWVGDHGRRDGSFSSICPICKPL